MAHASKTGGLMRSLHLLTVVIISLAAAASAAAQSQITTAVIDGTVVDASGAVLPGVEVEIRNADTNLTRTLTTDREGRFVALQLPPGRYTITLKLSGFATVVQEGVIVTVGETVRLSPTMKLSGIAETVTVTTTSPAVETTRTTAASTLDETTIESTPILGRKFEDLLTLTPGVSIVQGPDGDEITFAGQRGVFNNISLDGGDYTNGFFGEQVGGQRAAIDITLEAVKQFQVIATGASAEFGHTAGGVVNVITKSGTNQITGSLFHYQRVEGLTSNTSDGKPLDDFHREQFGGTIGGPIVRDKAFYFLALEGVRENLLRPNLSEAIGAPCPVSAPTLAANEALIAASADCQRLALLGFFRTGRGQDEGQPVQHSINNNATLAKVDFSLSPRNNLSASYNFDYSKNTNQTFDVATYGSSANGIEGPSKINVLNLNLFSTVTANKLNEFHATYSRENRPRSAVASSVPADTAMGFATTFRFGNPFFLEPNVDELVKRFQVKDNFSIVAGRHTVKTGAEWIHTNNAQVFRGFFEGRYIFDSVPGFLRYASPGAPGGFGPFTVGCSNGAYVTAPAACPGNSTPTGGPLLFYLQSTSPDGIARDAAGASDINNEELALFVQDRWQAGHGLTVDYGLRWDGQMMPSTVDPKTTAYASFLNDPRFPSDGTIHNQWNQLQPRGGFAWDVAEDGKSVVRGSAGIYYARQNMLSQVGSVTTNGIQQKSDFRNTAFTAFADMPVWPNLLAPSAVPAGTFPLFTGVRVFDRDYRNPRVYSVNVGFDRELASSVAAYVDVTVAKGVHLTRFLNYNVHGTAAASVQPPTRDTTTYTGGNPFEPQLSDVFVTNSRGHGLYRGATFGVRKRFSQRYQLEANYVLSKDEDDDSNERDPFTDRSFNFYDLSLDYGPSDRDIRHKFNFFTYAELPQRFLINVRMQGRTAQPITTSPRVLNGTDRGRNWDRKDNQYFSLDWRLQRPIRVGMRVDIIPSVEMFNTLNNANNVNPLTTPALFNFDGFLRQGVGDPRQVQVAIKMTF
ncbi:MAG: TonB-dependent receptor [Acidobacteria bacterium]|nr:MAG: TonB-dependent receptor [Acidobacteriota bacterium]PYR09350.1 MAG: TonB-dependent receptor [Acidobacteriota bacterium]